MTKQAWPGLWQDGINSHRLKSSQNALPLSLCALPARQQRQPAQRTAVMPSALRHQPHSWSDDPAELPSLASRVIEEGPAALTSMIKLIESGLAAGEGFSGGSVYTGLAGIAHAYLHLYERLAALPESHQGRHSHGLQMLAASREEFLLKATEMAELARANQERVTFLAGMPGILCVRAAAYKAQGQHRHAGDTAQEAQRWDGPAQRLPPGEDELLYSRAGYLYCLLFLHKHIEPMPNAAPMVHSLMQQIVLDGMRHPLAAEYGGLMYSWHGGIYLGAAHGLAGILHTLALAHKAFPNPSATLGRDLPDMIRNSTLALVDHAFPSGNLPSSHGSDTDTLVHWCHGTVGLLPLLLEAEGLCTGAEKAKVHAAAERAAQVIWERGLLLKGPGLCHGVSGNAYALLSAYQKTQDARYLVRATRFALWLAEHWQELCSHADRPLSLFEGISGAVYLWADLLAVHMSPREQKLENIYFPGYEI